MSIKNNIIDFTGKRNKKQDSEDICPLDSFLYEIMDEHGIDRSRLKTISIDEALDCKVNPGNPDYYRSLMLKKNRKR